MSYRVLSGMRPTGNLHLGNYFGAIKQFLDLQAAGEECFFFIADIHALTEVTGPTQIEELSVEVAKNYLACGINPAKSTLYCQSDVPEVSEIATLLGNTVSIAEMRRCTTYKGKRDAGVIAELMAIGMDKKDATKIVEDEREYEFLSHDQIRRIENKFSYGLLGYPVLMASDILCVRAQRVPVGQDQMQHVEMARDIARSFNHMFRKNIFMIPELNISNPLRVPGIDGSEKMGKSDGNTIALLENISSVTKKVRGIPTQAEVGGEMEKGTKALYALMELCSPPDVYAEYLRRYADREGKFFGEMKQRLADDIIALLEPIQQRYKTLSNDIVSEILADGAEKVRSIASTVLMDMRSVMGLKKKVFLPIAPRRIILP